MSGYTKVNARVVLTGKSIGVHFFLPVQYKKILLWGHTLVCLLTGRKECRDTLFLSSISKMQAHFSVRVHSCLLICGEKKV